MSPHNDNFISSENTIHTSADLDKIANLKAAIAANNHVFVFIYMDGCGHCFNAEDAWVEFTNDDSIPQNASAFAVSNAMMEVFGSALGDVATGFPTFRYIHNGNAVEYNGGRSKDDLIDWMTMRTQVDPPTTVSSDSRIGSKKTNKTRPTSHAKTRKMQGGGSRKKRIMKKRKTRKTRKTRKMRKTRKTRKTRNAKRRK